ncbi:response regulator [Sphingobium sp. BHU LFT2]|uniref:response regulator n=1 Tax=Sphingobium sp. BHU LFT2 TaxID=2807634 RepID=UPI001BEB6AD4|nr:response regulator [Sphingobium sp. BHU LFT2]
MGQSHPIGTKTILIVDDEPLLRFDLVDFFEAAGWRVFDAEDADQAITILEGRRKIRVVLTDVQMPGSINGLKLAHYIRNRFPPTILYIASGHVPLREDELPVRATFLPKPFDPHRLLRQLETAIK